MSLRKDLFERIHGEDPFVQIGARERRGVRTPNHNLLAGDPQGLGAASIESGPPPHRSAVRMIVATTVPTVRVAP